MSKFNFTSNAWSQEEEALLRREWPGSKSAAQISRMLGNRSRCAVIGRAHRLGLEKLEMPATMQPNTAPRPMVKAASKPKPAPKAKAAPLPKPYLVSETPEARDKRRSEMTDQGKSLVARMNSAAVNDNAIPFMKRTPYQCAWPLGVPDRPANQMCCGVRVKTTDKSEPLPYCEEHHARAFNGCPEIKGIGREYARPGERRRVASVWDGGRAA